ncbi:energy transducer TonB [Phenylobacterium sp.]|uniref:energy transducer TonB n=1 Tax=Phenylobacterium sp. TaxID=1871053 RepID=UPI0027376D8D|nr:energy transducer TonB [Phenylobacterium sp.]MDP3658508.1 energy transducer TonB [Phenylobacterium sp.]
MMSILALMALAASGDASTAPVPPIEEVRFAPLPTSERAFEALGPVGPFYPASAAQARQNGEAIIRCHTGPAGALARCKVISERPARYDFGVAATTLAQRKRIFSVSSHPPGEAIMVRVPFVLDALASSPASPPVDDVGPLRAASLKWRSTPSGGDFAHVFPAVAQRDSVEGKAILLCRISPTRGLNGCTVQTETPGNYGFGRAAVLLSKRFTLDQIQTDPRALEGAEVLLSLVFRLPKKS